MFNYFQVSIEWSFPFRFPLDYHHSQSRKSLYKPILQGDSYNSISSKNFSRVIWKLLLEKNPPTIYLSFEICIPSFSFFQLSSNF